MAEQAKSRPQGETGVLPEKKRKREARIVAAASELFSRQGYGETSIEAIARHADVAVGTVYNYFENKPALLMRVLTSGRSESLTASAALVDDPPEDPVEAVYLLVDSQMRGANRHRKELWRVIHATAALEPEAFGLGYFTGKEQFADHILALLRKLRDRRHLSEDTDVDILSRSIKYIASEVFRRYVASDSITIEDASEDLKQMIGFIVRLASDQPTAPDQSKS